MEPLEPFGRPLRALLALAVLLVLGSVRVSSARASVAGPTIPGPRGVDLTSTRRPGPGAGPSGEAPMRVRGDYLEMDNDDDVVVIKGNAYVQFGEMQLWADSIQGHLGRHEVQAQGNVHFKRPDEDLRGQFLVYNYTTKRGRVTDLRTKRGVNWIKASRVEIEPYELHGWDVAATTCDHDPPHYFMKASEMVLYPRDRMVLSDVALMMGGKARFRFPQYVIDMRPAGRQGNRLYVSPGYSGSKGFNLKSAYSFYFSPKTYGRAWFHPSQEGDNRYGIDVRYQPRPDASGSATFSQYRSSTLNQTEQRLTVTHRQQFGRNTSLNVDALMTGLERQGLGLDQEFNLNLAARTVLKDWELGLQFQKRIDLDGDDYTADSVIQSLDATPRFTFAQRNPHRIFGSDVGLRLEGRVERIRETSSGGTVTSMKEELTAHLTPKSIRLGNWSTWNWNVRDTVSLYSGAQDRNVLGLNVSTQERYGAHLATSVNYVYQKVNGTTPFTTYDQLSDQSLATWYLRMTHGERVSATLFQTSFDLLTGLFTAASSSFVVRNPSSDDVTWSTGLSVGYDLGAAPENLSNLKIRSLSANLRMERRDAWRHSLITNYDMPTRRLSSITAASAFLLSPTMKFMSNANFAFDTTLGGLDMTRLNLALVKDLHCWEGRLRVDVEQREAFLEFYLKAAGGKKLSIGVDYDTGLDVDPQLVDGERPGSTFSSF